MNRHGVSPVIATVLLISITVLLVSMVYVIATQMLATMPTTVTVQLMVEYREGENKLFICHSLGDNLRTAFSKKPDNKIALNNLVIRLDGRPPKSIRLNGEDNFTTDAFEAGDYLEVEFERIIQFGSLIVVGWRPTNQTLYYTRVR